MVFESVTFFALAIAGTAFMLWRRRRDVIVYDYQRALHYRDGRLVGEAGPGRHVFFSARDVLEVQDMRRQPLLLAGQDILTRDAINVRISLAGGYQIVDLKAAKHDTANVMHELSVIIQLEMRRLVAQLGVDDLLAGKGDLAADVAKGVQEPLRRMGLALDHLAVRDILLPANLKKALAGVVEAQKEAQRKLEVARGEQAVLRSLANSARLYEGNPALVQARLLQTLEQGGNTVMFGAEGLQPGAPAKARK